MNQQPSLAPGNSGSYRSRYFDYVNKQTQTAAQRPNSLARVGRGLLSFVIFVVLFLAILTLFGFWLSRMG